MVEKTSRYYQIGALIAVILASGAGYFMIASDSYDLCVSGGEYGVWNETDVNFRYECSIDHTFNNCWNITNYGERQNVKCMKYEIVGEFALYNESNYVGVLDDNLNIKFTPENITCYPYGSNDNFVSRCNFSITISDNMNESACLDLPLMYFVDNATGERLDTHYNYGKLAEYYYNYNNITNQTIITNTSYLQSDKICNIDHSRTVTGYFDVPYGSNGKFDTYFPFMGKTYVIDPYWVSNSSNFVNGVYTNTFLNSTFIQLNATYNNGTYESEVYNTGATSDFDNLSFVSNNVYSEYNLTNCTLYYAMNDTSTTITDYSGNGHGGTYNGIRNNETAVYKKGMGFDGIDDHIVAGGSGDFNFVDDFAVNAWIYLEKRPLTPYRSGIVQAYVAVPGSQGGGWVLAFNDVDTTFEFYDGAVFHDSGIVPELNAWNHVVVTRIDGEVDFYINNINELEWNSTKVIGNTQEIQLAYTWYSGNPTQCIMDEILIYKRGLNADEVNDMYHVGSQLLTKYRSCDDSACSGESYSNQTSDILINLSVTDNRYFQYFFNFTSSVINITPSLSNVTIGYTSGAPTDSCTYGTGNWQIEISDNCVLNTITDLTNANNLIIIGDDGLLTINTTIFAGEIHYTPDDFNGNYTIQTTLNGRVEVLK